MALFSWVKRYVRIVNTIIKDAGVIRITTYHQQNVIARSSFFFSQNTTNEKRGEFLSILGPMQDSRHGKYLGLPSVIRKSKVQVFAKIKGKVAKKLSGWKEKMLSLGGKEILIKVVAQVIPTYTMNCFLLPKGLW